MLPSRFYLTCHGLGTPPAGLADESCRYWLSVDLFERVLEVAAALERDRSVDIRFTFDDGNASDLALALPLLRKRGRKAKFFVCAGRIGKAGYLDAADLREVAAAGMTIGCHGHAHVNWRLADDTALHHELVEGRRLIETVAGRPVDVASAPFGGVDRRVVRAAAAAGYRCLFASSGGFATSDSGLIPRNTLKSCFEPEIDLPRMVGWSRRAWAGLYDTGRRVKYGYF